MQSQELNEPQESPPREPADEPAGDELAALYREPLSVRERRLGLMALGRERASW